VDLDASRRANILPRGLFHPIISSKVWAPFLHGEYETAVFCAFKEVEIAVRDASASAPSDLGVALMRRAFAANTIALSDSSLPAAEQDGLAHLFAGAFGYYRNPLGHRRVPINDPVEAVEMIVLASHLVIAPDTNAMIRIFANELL